MGMTLLLGGVASGKSRTATALAAGTGRRVTLIATAEALDDEMVERIARHRAQRPATWTVVEEPLALTAAIERIAAPDVLIVDCLTLWVSNLLGDGATSDDEVLALAAAAAKASASRDAPTIVVSNEVGAGIVPANALARRYRDLLGRVNATLRGRGGHRGADGGRPGRDTVGPDDDAGGAMTRLAGLLADLPGPDVASRDAVAARAATVLRPTGALARLDEVAAWLAAWQRTERPAVERPHAIVFAADHGVAAAGVSAYPAEVTVAMLDALEKGAATSAAMARALGVVLDVVDVGVARPTGDLRIEPAMDADRFDDAVGAGVEAVERAAAAGADLLVFGEMGIGNTTAAAAVAATLYDEPAAEWCGRGTGLDDAGLARKVEAVEACRARVRAGTADPIEILREAGGAELAAIAGATVAARRHSIPVVLDGYVVTAAVAPLASVRADALDHVIAGHRSAEPGHGRLLERLGLAPLLTLELRLGEGTGALAAVPLVRLAAVGVVEVATFQEWGLA